MTTVQAEALFRDFAMRTQSGTCKKLQRDLREDMYYIISISRISQSSLGSHVSRLLPLANESSFGITVLPSFGIAVIT